MIYITLDLTLCTSFILVSSHSSNLHTQLIRDANLYWPLLEAVISFYALSFSNAANTCFSVGIDGIAPTFWTANEDALLA